MTTRQTSTLISTKMEMSAAMLTRHSRVKKGVPRKWESIHTLENSLASTWAPFRKLLRSPTKVTCMTCEDIIKSQINLTNRKNHQAMLSITNRC